MMKRLRHWPVRAGLVLCAGVLALAAGACDGQPAAVPAQTAAPVAQATAVPTSTPTAAPPTATAEPTAVPTATPEAVATPTAAPTAAGPTGLELVEQATVQIVAQGTFVDPQVGVVQNQAGSGSGFIINEEGLVVTANHVVTGAATLNVYVPGRNKPVNARVVAADECSDLAIIDLSGGGYTFLAFYEGELRVGMPIFVAGYPLGEPEFALVAGIIAKTDAPGDSTWASVDSSLQHDALANPGNSGGPVVTQDGQVVGIHYASRPDFNQGFAISLVEALPVLELLEQGINVDWVGINGSAVSDGQGLTGIWVASVESGSPADLAGIKPGDVIIELERLTMSTDGTMKDYCDVLRTKGIGAVMQVKVLRFETNEVLEGQINGRELVVQQAIFAGQRGDEQTGAEQPTDLDLVEVVDDTGTISANLPSGWTIFTDAPGGAIAMLNAAPDIDAWMTSFAGSRGRHNPPREGLGPNERDVADAVGIHIQVIDPPGGDLTAILDSIGSPANCEFSEQVDYDDGVYVGVAQLFTCDHGGMYVKLMAVEKDAATTFVVWIEAVAISERDFEILGEFLDSFIISL